MDYLTETCGKEQRFVSFPSQKRNPKLLIPIDKTEQLYLCISTKYIENYLRRRETHQTIDEKLQSASGVFQELFTFEKGTVANAMDLSVVNTR